MSRNESLQGLLTNPPFNGVTRVCELYWFNKNGDFMSHIDTVHGKKPGILTPIASSIPAQKSSIHQSVFDALPNSGYVREAQLVQSPKRPNAPLPFSAPTLWRKVKAGTFPKPIKLSERVTAWNVGTVRAWMTAQATS
jgi:prophage regulatory protein